MNEIAEYAALDGRTYRLDEVVRHVITSERIVLCRDEAGARRYVSIEEWLEHADHPDAGEVIHHGEALVPPAVTRESSLDEKVSLVMSLFRGRTDVYAEGYVGRNTKDGKLSYWPRCRLRWVRGACPRMSDPKARCRDCDHPDYAPLTREVVSAHCTGRRDSRGRIQAVGIYVVDGDVCHLLAADFDGDGWETAATAYRDACRRHGLAPAVERSRSGNGAHVWVFFDGPVEASLARRVGEGLVSEARDACAAVSFRSYDRLFPLQDSVGSGNLGSLIALPLQGEAVRRGNSVFVDDGFVAYPDQCAYLSVLPKASASRIAELAEEFGDDPVALPDASSRRIGVLRAGGARVEATGPVTDGDAPAMVRVTLADGVRIKCGSLSVSIVNRLRRLAAFRNPEYGKRLSMHLSVWDVPRVVDLSEMDGDELVLPRGCAKAALETLREAGTESFVADCRTEGRHIHARFVGELRTIQEPCREKLAKYEVGVIVAPTGFGKSVIAASIIATHQVSTLVIVPNTSLLEQWRESLTRFLAIDDEPPVLLTPTGRRRKHQPGTVGTIGGGRNLRSGIVDVALAGSLFEKGEVAGDLTVNPLVAEYGMVIVDEAQHVAAAKVLQVLQTVRARYVYAMTATPKREDGLDRILFLECGPLRHEVAVADQIAEQGMRRLLVPRFSTSRPDLEATTTWHAIVEYISGDEERNALVTSDAVRSLRAGRTPLVLTRRVEHARTLAGLIESGVSGLEARVILLVGKDPDAVRRQRLEELRLVDSETPLCVIATGSYVGEGFDLDRLDCLLLAGPVAFEGALAQWVGRLHRAREGKSEVVVMDYVDPAIPMLDNEWRKRMKAYRKLGYVTAGEDDLELVGLEGRLTPIGHLFSGKGFLEGLERDLAECRARLYLGSSWVRLSRAKALHGLLSEAVRRGVAVRVALREPSKPGLEWERTVEMLRGIGCEVRTAPRGSSSLDFAVIDDALVWYGGIAPLAFPRREDCSLRIVSREVAAALVEATLTDGKAEA